MTFLELFILAIGLSMDAFAVAVCAGLTMAKTATKQALIVGLYFGFFQAGMPVIGYAVAALFADKIIAYDHWVAFVLLGFLGGRMILSVLRREGYDAPPGGCEALKPARMLSLSIATSIDALAVGVSFAFLQVRIAPAVSFIGMTTFALSVLGVKVGRAFGAKFKPWAELTGGVILVLIGVKILLEHLGG